MSTRIHKDSETLGERLRKRREELNITVPEMARELQTSQKYVEALEKDNFEEFSARVYALGFLKKILITLKFEDAENFLKEFGNEWEVRMFRKKKEPVSLPRNLGTYPLVTPGRLSLVLGGLFFISLLFFLGGRLLRFVGTPPLSIEEPKNNREYAGPLVRVAGTTEKESRLTVNGLELKINESGAFDEKIVEGPGMHVLRFVSINRFGKESNEEITIIVK